MADITSSKRIFFDDYVDSGIPFYRSKEIIEKAQKASVSTELFITNKRFDEIKNRFGAPSDGDILISAVGEASPVEIAETLQINRSTVQRNIKNLSALIKWTGTSPKDPHGKYEIIIQKQDH